MSEQHNVSFNLEIDVSRTYDDLRKLETLLYRCTSLSRRLGLPEDINAAILRIQHMIMVIRLLHTAMVALEAASGPLGWGLAIVGGASAVVSMSDFMMETR